MHISVHSFNLENLMAFNCTFFENSEIF